MVIVVLLIAAAACMAAAWTTNSLLLAYIALGLAVLCLLLLAGVAWKRRQAAGTAAADSSIAKSDEATVSSQDCDVPSVSAAAAEPEAPEPAPAIVAGESHERASAAMAPVDEATTAPDSESAVQQGSLDAVDTDVCIVPGRKRFHQPDCQLLAGHEQQTLTLAEALEEGFTPCSVCRSASTGSIH
ncbi:hypothetical protein SAMN06265360_1543 [Haloechinothrix alba]|uniref:Uncharacterized protein n=1 Tax=Haloechinothrix alba TaxID=664784 RepID=A0A239ASR4_9PSEU|nr:hypothetical protein [Haloechinothrix alba]SNR98003.1 hypothetical protein SAMN06265360_1543 [Haloechinothrix alba]